MDRLLVGEICRLDLRGREVLGRILKFGEFGRIYVRCLDEETGAFFTVHISEQALSLADQDQVARFKVAGKRFVSRHSHKATVNAR